MFVGAFTKNDQLTASPFADAFLYVPSVRAGTAKAVLETLNDDGADERKRELAHGERGGEMYGRGYVEHVYREWLEGMDRRFGGGEVRRGMGNTTIGYVTSDVSLSFSLFIIIILFIDLPDFFFYCKVLPGRRRRHPPLPTAVLQLPRLYRLEPARRGRRRTDRPRFC